SYLARFHLSVSTRQIKLRCFPAGRFGDLDIAGLHVAVVELKDDFQASRLPLVEDGVVGFWLSGGEGNDQANSDKRHSDNQRSIVHKTSHKLSPPESASKFITLCIAAVLQAMALCDGPNSVCTLVRPSLTTLHWNTRNTSTTCVNLSKAGISVSKARASIEVLGIKASSFGQRAKFGRYIS